MEHVDLTECVEEISILDHIAIRAESCRFAMFILGSDGDEQEYLKWISFFDRVQLEGAESMIATQPQRIEVLRIVK